MFCTLREEGWDERQFDYFVCGVRVGYSTFVFRGKEKQFRWEEFYPREFRPLSVKGLGTLAHVETLLWVIEYTDIAGDYINVEQASTSDQRKGHLRAMGIEGKMLLDEYLQKSLKFAERKFGWVYENPFEK
jgi:hypothetical protein